MLLSVAHYCRRYSRGLTESLPDAQVGGEMIVSNGGERIPPEQVTGLLEPFRRLSGRSGTGQVPGSACPSSHRWLRHTAVVPSHAEPAGSMLWSWPSRCIS
jgi:hypothetical protein